MNNNQDLSDVNGNLMEHNQLKEEIQNDSASVMTGNDDNMDTNEDDPVEVESSDDEDILTEKEPNLYDHPIFSSLKKEKDRVLFLLERGMTFIESLTKATREETNMEEAVEECRSCISDYYEALAETKMYMSKLICMASLHSPLNYEGSLYSERKRIEINNKKAKILTFETSIGKSGGFNDDTSSVNAFNNNLDNISQSNISYGNHAQTPNKM